MERTIPLLRSCERCRRRKQRCDGGHPTCGRCKSHNAECKYRQSGRFRKRCPKSPTPDAPKKTPRVPNPTQKRAEPAKQGQSPIMFSLPDMSPATDRSPQTAYAGTPEMVSMKQVDPLEILSIYDLPDPGQPLEPFIVKQMNAILNFPAPDSTRGSPADSSTGRSSLADTVVEAPLPPSLGLPDPRNIASRCTDACGPRAGSDDAEGEVPQALASLVQRYPAQIESATMLLSVLRRSCVDSNMKIRVRQFWATLVAGNISDFVLFAHLAVAMREAQVSYPHTLRPDSESLEAFCYEMAHKELRSGRVHATTGAVFAHILLSEYDYQCGRTASMWETALGAVHMAMRIVVRGVAFPWRNVRAGQCDVEFEHVLCCYWSAWVRLFTAAQALTRRFEFTDPRALPAYPLHDMCHYTAQPIVRGPAAAVDSVEFGRPACRHRDDWSYTAVTWHCCLLSMKMHNCYIDIIEKKTRADEYFVRLEEWHRDFARWHDTWPHAWDAQLAAVLEKASAVRDRTGEPRVAMARVGQHWYIEDRISAADSWLVIVHTMYHATRLRVHRIALMLLHREEDRPMHGNLDTISFSTPSLAQIPPDHRYRSQDVLRDSIVFHRSRYECLDATARLERVLAAAELVNFPMDRLGIWAVFVFEHLIAVECSRIGNSDLETQADALCRLALLVRLLLSLKRWTGALYVFTGLVKLYADKSKCVEGVPEAVRERCGEVLSPLPKNHVLTVLMALLDMDARSFFAYTLPIIYASMSVGAVPFQMRMRIATLISK